MIVFEQLFLQETRYFENTSVSVECRMLSGKLEADPHRTNPPTVCNQPEKVKQMRSFIGAFRAFSRCVPGYAMYLSNLEDAVAGNESAEKIL